MRIELAHRSLLVLLSMLAFSASAVDCRAKKGTEKSTNVKDECFVRELSQVTDPIQL